MKKLILAFCFLITFALDASPSHAQGTRWLHHKLPVDGLTKIMSVSACDEKDFAVTCDGFTNGMILRTSDAGNTWDTLWKVESGIMKLYDIAHPTKDLILAAVDSSLGPPDYYEAGSIIRSSDGGKTWQQTVFGTKDNPSLHSTKSLEMIDEEVGMATVTMAPLHFTTDGGVSWHPMPGDDFVYPAMMDAIDRFSVVVHSYSFASNHMKTYRTTDRGSTWDSSSVKPPDLIKIKMIDKNRGYALGYLLENNRYRGILYKTLDGGMNWAAIFDTMYSDFNPLTCLNFRDEHNGKIFGRNGLVFSTSDGGSSWSTEAIEYNITVDMGAFFDAKIISDTGNVRYVATGGDGGMIVQQTSELLPWPKLIVPSAGVMTSKTFTAQWMKSGGAEHYELKLFTNTLPRQLTVSEMGLTDTSYFFTNLTHDSYFIEVRAVSTDNVSNWSKILFSTMLQSSVDVTNDDEQIQLYPNPVISNTLRLSYPDHYHGLEGRIVNTIGEFVLTCTIADDNSIDVSTLAPGAYTLILTGSQGISTKGFIKTH